MMSLFFSALHKTSSGYDTVHLETSLDLVLDSNGTTAEALINARAPLASPSFTGSPLAPTQAVSDSSDKLATTAFVARAVANIVNGNEVEY